MTSPIGDARLSEEIYAEISGLPIISPHGHIDPVLLSENRRFSSPTAAIIHPDHYLTRLLISIGVDPSHILPGTTNSDREVWQLLARNYSRFYGTPSKFWVDNTLRDVFKVSESLNAHSADDIYNAIDSALHTDNFAPRSIYEQFRIRVLATTDFSTSNLAHHISLKKTKWPGVVIPTYRPDDTVDPDFANFNTNIERLGELTRQSVDTWEGYLMAHRERRGYFKLHGAVATDHGHPTPITCDFSVSEARSLFERVRQGQANLTEREQFRGQMLTEMVKMSLDDGLVTQLHAGSVRNHNYEYLRKYGPDKGADIPQATDFVHSLRPLLQRYGMQHGITLIVFTLDEATYSRELSPLAGFYPLLKIGAPWWFHDAPDAILRFRKATTETAGFYNTVGFNDDSRSLLSIRARHQMSRKMDSVYLAGLVEMKFLTETEAVEVAKDLTLAIPASSYNLHKYMGDA